MHSAPQTLLGDLRLVIADLREDGGLMSPSIYDTAQALRYSPPRHGLEQTIEWLLAQQREDGGWGNPSAPRTRDIPTIASLLALNLYDDVVPTDHALQQGVAFLNKQVPYWDGPLSDDLPVGAELILPRLLEEADRQGLQIPTAQYGDLLALGHRKRSQIARLNPGAGTPAAFSWEAWGADPDPDLLDESGGVGHNPAATAYWLSRARQRPDLAPEIALAQSYLEKAAKATRADVPGVMPTAWPIDRYEQAFVLHTLLLADLLDHPALEDVVQPQLQDLAATVTSDGIGFSDYFTPDGDDTAAAVAALKGAGFPSELASLQGFRKNGHFLGYHGELQGSHSLTARAIHALLLFEEDVTSLQDFLLEQQQPDGRWLGDKWHTSWLYATLLAVFALKHSQPENESALALAVEAIQAAQNLDGGWGHNGISVITDTAYGALALYVLREHPGVRLHALKRAQCWLLDNYRPFEYHRAHSWLNKQQYAPYRIDWGFALSASLALLALDGGMISA